jgi:hypothetical protein
LWRGHLLSVIILAANDEVVGVVFALREGKMAIARIFVFGSLLALIGSVGFAFTCAAEPCCGWVGGKYINLKTGKPALPSKDAHAPSGSVETAKPQPDDVIIVIGPAPEPKRATNK